MSAAEGHKHSALQLQAQLLAAKLSVVHVKLVSVFRFLFQLDVGFAKVRHAVLCISAGQ